MTGKTTVSKEIFKWLSEKGGFVPSGEIEEQHFLDATGSTITRKLRDLHDAKFIAVKYVGEHRHAHYKVLKTQAERDSANCRSRRSYTTDNL